jgi:hypothetical protein
MGGQQEQLLFAAEYKRMEETSRGQGYLEGTIVFHILWL